MSALARKCRGKSQETRDYTDVLRRFHDSTAPFTYADSEAYLQWADERIWAWVEYRLWDSVYMNGGFTIQPREAFIDHWHARGMRLRRWFDQRALARYRRSMAVFNDGR